jgi:GNAT superfamily N-acetyltransferase
MQQSMISIRKAIPADNAACRELVQRSLSDFGIVADFDGLDLVAAAFGIHVYPFAIELVAESEGEFVACIMIHPASDTSAKVFGFHVRAEQQGKGIGKRLLESAVLEASNLGFTELKLDTCERMQSAVRLYETMGWKRIADPLPESGADRSYIFSLLKDKKKPELKKEI